MKECPECGRKFVSKDRQLCLWCLRTKSTIIEPEDVPDSTEIETTDLDSAPIITIEFDDDAPKSKESTLSNQTVEVGAGDSAKPDGTIETEDSESIELIELDEDDAAKNSSDAGGTVTSPEAGHTILVDDDLDETELIELDSPGFLGSKSTTASPETGTSPQSTKSTLQCDDIKLDRETLGSLLVNRRSLKPIAHKDSDAADYELVKQLGQGGMGIVFKAKQTSLNRHVAIKQVKGTAANSERSRLKFVREATITSELAHPNIIPIHDLGVAEDGGLYYSMKEVHGDCWMDVYREKTLDQNLEILLDVCDAIGFAHSKHFIHRDLKPENIMLGDFGEVLVMDWGMAVDLKSAPSPGGSPAYMSPEMASHYLTAVGVDNYKDRPSKIGTFSDIYLLGSILFEIVTGEPPHFGSETTEPGKAIAECLAHAAENKVDWQDFNNVDLLHVAQKSLATKPEDRYATVKEFKQAIRDYQLHATSIRRTDRAEQDHQTALKNENYDSHARSIFGFQEAIDLWNDNDRAKSGLKKATIAYAGLAEQNNDFELGMSLLNPELEDEKTIYDRLAVGAGERERKVKRFRLLRNTIIGLVSFVLIGTIVGLVLVDTLRRSELAAKNEATENAKQAEKQKAKAIASKKVADKNASIAQTESDRATKLAALEAAANREANAQKDRAEAALVEARLGYFVSRMALSESHLRDHNTSQSKELLREIRIESEATGNEKLGWAWNRLNHLCHPEVRDFMLPGTHAKVCLLGQSRLISAAAKEGSATVQLWDTKSQQMTLSCEKVSAQRVNCIAATRDGSHFILGCHASEPQAASLFVFNANTGRKTAEYVTHAGEVRSVLLLDDNRTLITGGSGANIVSRSDDHSRLKIWGLNFSDGTLSLRRAIFGHQGTVINVSISSDQKKLASLDVSTDASRIFVHSLDEIQTPAKLESSSSASTVQGVKNDKSPTVRLLKIAELIHCIAFSKQNPNLLACGTDLNSALMLDIERFPFLEKNSRTIERSNAKPNVNSVNYISDLKQTLLKQTLIGHNTPVTSLTFANNDEYLLTGGNGGEIIVWRPEPNAQSELVAFRLSKKLTGHQGVVESIDIQGQQVVSSSRDGVFRFWDLLEFRDEMTLETDSTQSSSLSQSGERFVITQDGIAFVQDATGQRLAKLETGHESRVKQALFSKSKSRLFTSAADGSICVWDAHTGIQISRFSTNGCFAISSDGEQLVTAADGKNPTQFWDVKTKKLLRKLQDRGDRVSAMNYISGSDELICGFPNGRISLRNLQSGTVVWQNDGDNHANLVSQIFWLEEERQILSVSESGRDLRLWNHAGKLLNRISFRGKPAELVIGKETIVVICSEANSFAESLHVFARSSLAKRRFDFASIAQRRAISAGFLSGMETLTVLTDDSSQLAVNMKSGAVTRQPPNASDASNGLFDKRDVAPIAARSIAARSIVGGRQFAFTANSTYLEGQNGTQAVQFDGQILKADFLVDENHLVTLSSDGILRFWDLSGKLNTGIPPSLERQMVADEGSYIDFLVSPDRQSICTITRTNSAVVRSLLDVAAQSAPIECDRLAAVPRHSAWSNDLIASASGQQVEIWKTSDRTKLAVFRDSKLQEITCVQVSPEGKFLIVADSAGLVLGYPVPRPGEAWDVTNPYTIKAANRTPSPTTAIRFANTDDRLVTGDSSGTVVVWYFSRELIRELLVIRGHRGPIHSLDFSGPFDNGSAPSLLTSDGRKTILHFARSAATK